MHNCMKMVYVGNGQCKHPDHPAQQDPGDYCEDFHCGMAKEAGADVHQV